jgi:hypothetical protein
MLRVLDHDGDADARLVAILMRMMGRTSLVVTARDEQEMAERIRGCALVLANCPDGSGSIELRIVSRRDLPHPDEAIN